ncbi:MAG: prepilin-type N-terminal cleavage/methylation domain-containing protein [Acidobacteria bacterium]|nr:prepilin-type N-terminal cleavage/methylation domain-containing protein [Acidobacteriota bacterium]
MPRTNESGFTLLEALVAILILTVGLMGLAQVLYVGLSIAATSTPNLVAREKAREAIESVHTARDTHTIQWAQIRNNDAPPDCIGDTTGVGGGVFESGEVDMLAPGPDGLVNTPDDIGMEATPGPDHLLGTEDDVPLNGYTRQIDICDVNGNPDLRQIDVTIRYNSTSAFGERRREYRLTTFISSFS